MIERLYIHNFRSLENFVLPVSKISSALLVGKNGAGKSSVGYALEILQKIGRGENRIKKLIKPNEISHGRISEPVRLELEVRIAEVRYNFCLALDFPDDFRELRVLEESLHVDGEAKYTRKFADIEFPREGTSVPSMSFDWHLVWLSVAQGRSDKDPIGIFRKWLARILVIRPYPFQITGDSTEETLHPIPDFSNLGDWWNGIISHSPSSYSRIEKSLKRLMPDLIDIKNPVTGNESRSLEVLFDSDGDTSSIPFSLLSDGEKCMMIWGLVMTANEAYGPLLCFWDEPDNYLAISEVGDFAMDLRRAFANGGQFIATSHNAETIKQFSDENTFLLFRRSHMEPTQVRPLTEINFKGDLIDALVRDEI